MTNSPAATAASVAVKMAASSEISDAVLYLITRFGTRVTRVTDVVAIPHGVRVYYVGPSARLARDGESLPDEFEYIVTASEVRSFSGTLTDEVAEEELDEDAETAGEELDEDTEVELRPVPANEVAELDDFDSFGPDEASFTVEVGDIVEDAVTGLVGTIVRRTTQGRYVVRYPDGEEAATTLLRRIG